MHAGITVQGFRSSFRDWAGEETNTPHDVCEAALAHTRKDKVHAAYQPGDLFKKRDTLMRYCEPPIAANWRAVRTLTSAPSCTKHPEECQSLVPVVPRLTFILPFSPSAAVRPPMGDDWLHEVLGPRFTLPHFSLQFDEC